MDCIYYNKATNNCRYSENEKKYICAHHQGEINDNGTTIITKDFSENVFFAPWIGKEYESSFFFGKKTMILGNSHYCRESDLKKSPTEYEECIKCGQCIQKHFPECCYYTIDVIGHYIECISAPWNSLKVLNGLSDEELLIDEKYKEIRDKIVFYNYVQEALANGEAVPTKDQCRKSDSAFFEVIETLRPELIIALGVSHMYYRDMPDERFEIAPPLFVDGKRILHGFYTLTDGSKILTIWIYHPSARMSFDYRFWNKVIRTAVEKYS